jgi:hypothetical protein
MKNVSEESWWLDWSALPHRLLWARLRDFADGSAEVLDLDGKYHQFSNSIDGRFWLAEDEYSKVEDLIEEGEVPAATQPPQAANDRDLIPLMLHELSG